MKRENNSDKKSRRTLYFDYEFEWKIKVSTSHEYQIEDNKYIENELLFPSDDELKTTFSDDEFSMLDGSQIESTASYGSTISMSELPSALLE